MVNVIVVIQRVQGETYALSFLKMQYVILFWGAASTRLQGRDQKRLVFFLAEQPAPAPHLAHPEGCSALHIVLITVPRLRRSGEQFPDGFDLRLLRRNKLLALDAGFPK